jgi:capsular polysaccharide biosynthesis protein
MRSMYRDHPQAIQDSRFDRFAHKLGKTPLLEDARQFAQGYIEACSSPVGLEVDEPLCKGIGGHIHIATITTPEGFRWVIEPACSS